MLRATWALTRGTSARIHPAPAPGLPAPAPGLDGDRSDPPDDTVPVQSGAVCVIGWAAPTLSRSRLPMGIIQGKHCTEAPRYSLTAL